MLVSTIDVSVQLHAVDMLSALCVIDSCLLELGLPSLVEHFGRLLGAPSPASIQLQLASSISSALVHIARACVGWELCQTLLSGGLLRRIVAVCVISCDIISPMLENVAIILSLFVQIANER